MSRKYLYWRNFWAVFHTAWGNSKSSPDYKKNFWMEVQNLIEDYSRGFLPQGNDVIFIFNKATSHSRGRDKCLDSVLYVRSELQQYLNSHPDNTHNCS